MNELTSRKHHVWKFGIIALMCVVMMGCSSDTAPAEGEDCDDEGATQSGYICEDGSWVLDEEDDKDAGVDDAGADDAGAEDAGADDTGTEDAGTEDTGTEDAGECEPESDEEFCERHFANCGELTADDNCHEERTVDCGECDEGECGEAVANLCGCPCEIDGECYADGEPSEESQCLVCDSEEDEHDFVALADGTECDDGDECTEALGECAEGECVTQPFCEGSDADCGCDECEDCTESDGWVDDGEPYECCDGPDEACMCQDEELREHFCDGTECAYEVVSRRTTFFDCEECGPLQECAPAETQCVEEPDCEEAGDCGLGEQCCAGECISVGASCTDCGSDDDCPMGQQCCEAECISQWDSCDEVCESDDDCGMGQECCEGECIFQWQGCE